MRASKSEKDAREKYSDPGYRQSEEELNNVRQRQGALARTPDMRKRAIQRVREDKENLIPEKPGNRSNRRRYYASSRSPLPSDYPRAPLQDIRIYVNAITVAGLKDSEEIEKKKSEDQRYQSLEAAYDS